jgi:hypothetical protein
MRIFTDISVSKERGDYQLRTKWQGLFFENSPLADRANQCFLSPTNEFAV